MKKDNYKTEKFIFGIFLGFGILFFAIGVLVSVLIGNDNKEDYVTVTAVISDIVRNKDNHRVYIDYEYDGQQYTDIRYNFYSSSMRKGKEIEILVNMYDPTDIYMGNLSLIFLLSFGGFGLLFGLIGGIPIFIIQKKIIHNKKLKATGKALWGTVEEVCVNFHVKVNGGHPKYVVVKYEDDGIITATSHFKSDDFWLPGDGSELIGKNAKIFVNPQDMADYVVDIESIQTGDQYYGF